MRWMVVLPALLLVSGIPRLAVGQTPAALRASDLTVAGIEYRSDSSEVRRRMGEPATRDSFSWRYAGLRVWFNGAKVEQVQLSGRRFRTPRGLRVGDSTDTVERLYGVSCVQGGFAYCWPSESGTDPRGILIDVRDGRVTAIHVGAVFGT